MRSLAGEDAVKWTEVKVKHCWMLCFVTEPWNVLGAGLTVISDHEGTQMTRGDWKVPIRGMPFSPKQHLQAGNTLNLPSQRQPSALAISKALQVTF